MQTKSPFSGLVVIRRTYRNGAFVEIAEGDEVRPNTPILDIVDTSAMRVRVRLNQAEPHPFPICKGRFGGKYVVRGRWPPTVLR